MKSERLLILVAPNVSEQMGGEAMKALHIFRELAKIHPNTIQITHARNRHELTDRLNLSNVIYIEDSAASLFLWNSVIFRWLLDIWFSRAAVRRAEIEAERLGSFDAATIIHQTEPNSPVLPRSISRKHVNVFGPINGNIYYPRIFRSKEKIAPKLRRIFHMPAQRILGQHLFRSNAKAQQILVAGGRRTEVSLLASGCPNHVLVESVDCGVSDHILDRPRVHHRGRNTRFVHFGRLVFHKGTSLIIQSLAHTRHDVQLDVVGSGPELDRCKQLTEELHLTDRVRFLDWFTRHEDLLDTFHQYRGVVLPSMEDANGIVIQEAMAVGLPPICLDWGGPQLLIDHGTTGFLIEPKSVEHITRKMADYMDSLSEDPALAERLSIAGRNKAESWRWSRIARTWLGHYPETKVRR